MQIHNITKLRPIMIAIIVFTVVAILPVAFLYCFGIAQVTTNALFGASMAVCLICLGVAIVYYGQVLSK